MGGFGAVKKDAEFEVLAAVASGLRDEHQTSDDLWSLSPFRWIRSRPSRSRGAIGEKLVAGWCRAHEINVQRSPDSEADRILDGVRAEIKLSTLWKARVYKFQQIRDQDYDLLICLGLSPFEAHAWVFEKDWLVSKVGQVPGLRRQHGGASGQDTAWLSVSPADVHPWMNGFGGDLRSAMRRLRELLGLPPLPGNP